jgi:hypothetical protein
MMEALRVLSADPLNEVFVISGLQLLPLEEVRQGGRDGRSDQPTHPTPPLSIQPFVSQCNPSLPSHSTPLAVPLPLIQVFGHLDRIGLAAANGLYLSMPEMTAATHEEAGENAPGCVVVVVYGWMKLVDELSLP